MSNDDGRSGPVGTAAAVSRLPARQAAVLAALVEADGRVLSRTDLARAAGLGALSPRRVDSVLTALRRRLPPGAVTTVRGRGWALAEPGSSNAQ